jgi:hypothetical protein
MLYENFQLSTGNNSQGIKIVAGEDETVDIDKTKLYNDGTTLTNIKPPTPVIEEQKSYLWVVLLIVGLLLAIVIIFFMLRKKRDISDENDDE